MNRLSNKIQQYEVTPPANTWSHIAAALDEQAQTHELSSRLYDTTVPPPTKAWAAIQSSLEKEVYEKVVPMRRKAPAFLRYAAAIIILAIVGFGIIRLTSGNNNDITADTEPVLNSDSLTQPGNPTPSEDLALAPTAEDSFPDESPALLAGAGKPVRNVVRNALRVDYSAPEEEEDYTSSTLADRYIMMMTPDGNFIRVSKKLSELVCCVTGEENNEQCNDQIKKWQQKIASAPIAPSPDNFMDILSLVNSLDEGIDL